MKREPWTLREHCARRRRLASLCLLALVSCSSGADGPGRSLRPVLRWDDPAPPPSATRSVFRFPIPTQAAAWGDLHPTSTELAKGAGWTVGVWRGGGRLTLDLPEDLPAFDSVVVRGTFRAAHSVDLRLSGGGFSESWVHNVPGQIDSAVREVVLSSRDPDLAGPRPRELMLVVGGPDCTLEAIEFSVRGLQDSLPGPDRGRSVELEGEGRVAVGLSSARAMAAEFLCAPGDALEFSYGRWPDRRARAEQAELRVTLITASGPSRHSFPLEPGSGWRSAHIDLDAAAGAAQRARFELVAGADAEVACALGDLWVGQRAAQVPTVVLITSDTHRSDHLGSAGFGVDVETPALDALAGRGVLFEDCYSAINNTIPSHASLFTGLSPRLTRVLTNFERLAPEAFTLGDAFRAGGFRTFGVYSAPHLGPAEGNVAQGFDRLEPAGGAGNAAEAAERLLGWVDEAEGQPLFVWVHLFDAHQPYGPPGRGAADADPAELYRAEVEYLDRELARLFEHPRLGSGVVAFTADHGETLAKPGAQFDHTLLLPSTLHIPLILAWPDAPGGTRVAAPVSLVDLGRTLLDLGGLGPASFPGDNLTARLPDGPGPGAPRFALGDRGTYAGVTSDELYLVLQLGERGRGGMELARHQSAVFNRRSDPASLEDISASQPDRARTLRALLIDWLSLPGGETLGQASDLSPERLEALRALGYTGDDGDEPSQDWIDPECDCEFCVAGRS